MTAPREHVLRKARQWAAYADEDIRLAQQALNMGEQCPNRLAAYHAQQCAEKYLKAYLVHKEVDFPFTHNISLLLELCEESGAWAETLHDAEALTRYAVTTRYPGEEAEVALDKAQQAVAIGLQVRDTIRKALPAGD